MYKTIRHSDESNVVLRNIITTKRYLGQASYMPLIGTEQRFAPIRSFMREGYAWDTIMIRKWNG